MWCAALARHRTLLSGDGAVVGQWFVQGGSTDELKVPLEGLKKRFDQHNFDLLVLYTDQCE